MNKSQPQIPISFIGEREILNQLHEELKNNSEILKIEDVKKSENIKMNFDLSDAANLVTIVLGVDPIIKTILPLIYNYFAASKNKKTNRIVLKTPKGSIEITSDSNIEIVISQLKSKI